MLKHSTAAPMVTDLHWAASIRISAGVQWKHWPYVSGCYKTKEPRVTNSSGMCMRRRQNADVPSCNRFSATDATMSETAAARLFLHARNLPANCCVRLDYQKELC